MGRGGGGGGGGEVEVEVGGGGGEEGGVRRGGGRGVGRHKMVREVVLDLTDTSVLIICVLSCTQVESVLCTVLKRKMLPVTKDISKI